MATDPFLDVPTRAETVHLPAVPGPSVPPTADADALGHRRLIVQPDVGRLVGREDVGLRLLHPPFGDLLSIHVEGRLATLAGVPPSSVTRPTSAARIWRSPIVGTRRVLLPRTRYHVYYVPREKTRRMFWRSGMPSAAVVHRCVFCRRRTGRREGRRVRSQAVRCAPGRRCAWKLAAVGVEPKYLSSAAFIVGSPFPFASSVSNG